MITIDLMEGVDTIEKEYTKKLLNLWLRPNRCPSTHADDGFETWPCTPDSTRTSV